MPISQPPSNSEPESPSEHARLKAELEEVRRAFNSDLWAVLRAHLMRWLHSEQNKLEAASNYDAMLRTQGAIQALKLILGDGPEAAAVAEVQSRQLPTGAPQGADYMGYDAFPTE